METQSIEQSQRINLGSGNLKFSNKANRKLSYFLALLFFYMGLSLILNEDARNFTRLGMGPLYLLAASLYMLKAQFEFSTTSKYAPHFIVSEQGLKIKTAVFKKSEFISWDSIKEIELGNYKIGIRDRTGFLYFPYKTRKETSIELKRSIEAIAAQKGVEVENLLKK
ncbi:hypothetical protein [Marivirga harenae]|uniref:hypothetical protein n=1 Tax=Marivirga harenae TaxID=2010992 RepID=UPI0026DFF090|nr:hypothetical protein [Marivirga harenae]WKV13570.1 hypothetical protein Q3Y49_06975 [Marivirga harenae]|tara:strand:- start:210303 stop:210803 length:501 start_codon:yes stop_codon:yes gene_type:complete